MSLTFAEHIKRDPKILKSLTPKWSRYIPEMTEKGVKREPSTKQTLGLLLDHYKEIFYGGAAGGGKTEWLLMSALQYFDQPGYRGLILRRTFPMLNAPDSIMSRAHDWLRGTGARWKAKEKQYISPEGGILQFGYLQYDKDVYQYDGPAYHFLGFDELSQFTEWSYRFMHGRVRRNEGDPIPLRIRSTSNPGAMWVKDWFITEKHIDRLFIQALIEDNKYLNQKEYIKGLEALDPVLFAQRRHGDWEADAEGSIFKRSWPIEFLPEALVWDHKDWILTRFWDIAATQNGGDYTAGVLLGRHKTNKNFCIFDVVRGQWHPGTCDKVIRATAEMDGRRVRIRMEQEPGASGVHTGVHYAKLLAGFDFKVEKKNINKVAAWRPMAAQMEAGLFTIRRGPWMRAFIDELFSVTSKSREYKNDDQVDAASGAMADIVKNSGFFGIASIGGSNNGNS